MSKRALLALAWAIVILVLCLIPGSSLPAWTWFALLDLDKLVHAGMFFVLALLLASALQGGGTQRYLLWACAISIGYGVATEFMQGLEALGRRTDPADMIANSVGAFLAVACANWRVNRSLAIVPLPWLR